MKSTKINRIIAPTPLAKHKFPTQEKSGNSDARYLIVYN